MLYLENPRYSGLYFSPRLARAKKINQNILDFLDKVNFHQIFLIARIFTFAGYRQFYQLTMFVFTPLLAEAKVITIFSIPIG